MRRGNLAATCNIGCRFLPGAGLVSRIVHRGRRELVPGVGRIATAETAS